MKNNYVDSRTPEEQEDEPQGVLTTTRGKSMTLREQIIEILEEPYHPNYVENWVEKKTDRILNAVREVLENWYNNLKGDTFEDLLKKIGEKSEQDICWSDGCCRYGRKKGYICDPENYCRECNKKKSECKCKKKEQEECGKKYDDFLQCYYLERIKIDLETLKKLGE